MRDVYEVLACSVLVSVYSHNADVCSSTCPFMLELYPGKISTCRLFGDLSCSEDSYLVLRSEHCIRMTYHHSYGVDPDEVQKP